jgi:glycosyltransferase involved in cell wall biosynthesis
MMNDPDRHPDKTLPTASVVTTVYNRERLLLRAMRSVLGQSFTDFEYIVVDDGSTDESAAIAESTGDSRVTVVRAPHRGRAAALNTAFALCRAEFILIQDSDDIALPERFAKQITFLREHPEVGMVGCQCRLVDSTVDRARNLRFPLLHDDMLLMMMCTSAVPFGACIMRQNVTINAGPFDESLVAAEDYEFQLRMLRHARFHNLDILLQEIHLMKDSMSTLWDIDQRQIIMRSALAFLEQEHRSPEVFDDRSNVRMGEALVHYYYGELNQAKSILLGLLRETPFSLTIWRYLLPTLLGGRVIRYLRHSGISRFLTSPFKQSRFLRKHFLP